MKDPGRGGLSSNIFFSLSNGLMAAHISEFPGGTYMKSHHHGPGAHLLCLSGQGYELMWPGDSGIRAEGVERLKIPWKKGVYSRHQIECFISILVLEENLLGFWLFTLTEVQNTRA